MPNSNPSPSAVRRFLVLTAAGVAITLATGLVHGRLTQRWGPVPDLQAAARNLQSFPTAIGEWQLVSEEPIDDPTRETLSCAGYVNRQYINRQSGQTVSIAIIVGPPGPTAVHTPEICYSSRAYSIHEPAQRVTLSDNEGRTHSFWSLSFRSKNSSRDKLHVSYAWRAQELWTASESPRFEFAGQRLLYKLQIASEVSALAMDKAKDPCQEFLAALLRCGWKSTVRVSKSRVSPRHKTG